MVLELCFKPVVLVDDGKDKPESIPITRSIGIDVGWGMFCTMLKYKAEFEGKTYIEIDRFFPSSKTCHVCLNQTVFGWGFAI
jgi:Putative transposase DNA-binding domain